MRVSLGKGFKSLQVLLHLYLFNKQSLKWMDGWTGDGIGWFDGWMDG